MRGAVGTMHIGIIKKHHLIEEFIIVNDTIVVTTIGMIDMTDQTDRLLVLVPLQVHTGIKEITDFNEYINSDSMLCIM